MLRSCVRMPVWGVSLWIIVLMGASVRAAEERPQTLVVAPAEIQLAGPRSQQRLQVTGVFSDRLEADLTTACVYESLQPQVAVVTPAGVVFPRGDGVATIVVRHAGRQARTHVTVAGFQNADPIDFRTEVIAALSRGGCNQGACHGSPQGKNGFRLSLRGFDPALDFVSLTREAYARRTNPSFPSTSLLLAKATGRIPHQGGTRFRADDPAYRLLLDWIAEGCRDSHRPHTLQRLEVLPAQRFLHTSSPRQQIVVRAHFADGSTRDVTDLAVFTVSDASAVRVRPSGMVEFDETAEAVVLVRYLEALASVRLSYVRRDPHFVFAAPPEANEVDRHVFAKQRQLQLTPAALASDAVFLRRVYLDLIGLLPTPEEARAFLDSPAADRRARLIDRLLERDEFARFWALKWADVMRGNREAITERGVHLVHRYLVRTFAEDRPFDQVARELLTSQGNTIHKAPANFFRIARMPEEAAESMAQLFLGVRIQCARCHNHPYEAITQQDYHGLAAYFARVRQKRPRFGLDDEIIYLGPEGEVKHPTTGKPVAPAAFGEPAGPLGPEDDRRARLADWLTQPGNRYFARSTVNRLWYHLMGRGIVDPIDDFRDSNPPTNAALLDALAEDFIRGGFRCQPILRTILNSSTYQLSAQPASGGSSFAADPEPYFTHAVVRLLTAEQILDAISSATGVPERFKGYPLGTRAMELAEGAVEHHFLKAFAKPVRDLACECARETDPSLNQVIHLLNNRNLLAKIDSPHSRLARWLKDGKATPEIIESMYLATLSRRPTPEETALASQHIARVGDRVAGLRDVQQALLNSNEFLLRH